MTKEKAKEIVYDKYNIEVLYEICRYADKNTSMFEWDYDKESLDADDIVNLLIEKEMRKVIND